MSMAYLGPSFDIHTGGVDLIFPHHEDEIAQSEAATGKPFVGTWLHCAHLRLGGEKMARSVGNISRVVDLLEGGVSARALRYSLISVHYRQGLEHSEASLDAATAAIDRLDALVTALEAYGEDRADARDLERVLATTRAAFEAALDDDLNVSAGLAAIFELVRELNRRLADRALSTGDAARALAFLRELDVVLAILPDPADDLPPAARALLDAREAARARRDWPASDRLRDELLALGVAVEDTRDGQRWRRLESVR
jgi:cysteinyl-tRNA synthetase